MKTKEFDCVEMMHAGGARLQRKLRGMTLEEQMAFWRQSSRELRRRQQAARRKAKAQQ
jgi:hypothetical protein